MGWKLNICVVTFSVILFRIFLVRRESDGNNVLTSMNEVGYEGELHHAITEDGYILGLQRIIKGPKVPNKLRSKTKNKRPPILLVHGLESSAIDWIHYLGENSLPYLLFEEGYDVWLGNVRGTPSSLNHTSLDPYKNAKKFWDTSVHEIGYYDLPAMIDYVLNTTQSKKLSYIGMSQGEATFLIMTSTRPEYNSKILLASLTAPSSHLKNSDNTLYKTLGSVWPTLQIVANFIGLNQVPGRDVVSPVCQYKMLSSICNLLLHPLMGYADPEQSDLERVNRFFQIYPTKSAFKQLLHYLQMYNSGIFRRFDYGKEENMKRYASTEPPEYDLKKVSAPVAYFWGENDCWSRPKDVSEIEAKLSNLVLSYKVPFKMFNHYDVMIARDAKELIYSKIIQTVEKYL